MPSTLLNGRQNGGHLLVNPPREVWERSELTPVELMQWSFLIAATGEAMLDTLLQLAEGCINYWEAGNWALNDQAAPRGRKLPREHRRVHMHLFGRSPVSVHPDWQWGESPRFPKFVDVKEWSSGFSVLDHEECVKIRKRIEALLIQKYAAAS